MSALLDFFYMDGHGLYVWLCYGVTALVLTANCLQPLRQRRLVLREVRS